MLIGDRLIVIANSYFELLAIEQKKLGLDIQNMVLISKTSIFPICLFWSANFIFGYPKEANWNTKSEIRNIEVLDINGFLDLA